MLLVDETQMSKPPEATRHHNSTKLLILLPLRAIYFHSVVLPQRHLHCHHQLGLCQCWFHRQFPFPSQDFLLAFGRQSIPKKHFSL